MSRIPHLPTLSLPVRRHSQVGLCQNLTAAVDSQVVLRVINLIILKNLSQLRLSSSDVLIFRNSSHSPASGDTQSFADEGIYGWIFSLIEKGDVARFINRHLGVYELDWQDVVWKYWFEFRAARKDPKRNKEVKFNHRTASNSLRAALLNSYKDKGAEEYPEKKVMDRENKTIKRSFRMPSTVIEKLSNYTGPDVS